MKRRVLSLLLIAVCSSGCTTMIAEGGKNMRAVFSPTNDVAHIRQALGPPTAEAVYPNAKPAALVRELAKKLEFRQELAPEALIARYEDYKFRGRVRAPDTVGLALMNQYLPIIGEVLLFPCAAWHAIRESRSVHRFRVWYTTEDRYFTHIELRATD